MSMIISIAPCAAGARRALSQEESALVCAGTFTPNTYSKAMYHAIGISTSYHFFDKDEFSYMGQSITYDQANAMVQMARTLRDAMNSGYRGQDTVGYGEPAFIRAYNSQLKIAGNTLWDGTAGHDF